MTDQPHYPYADGDRAVLGPEVTATADGMTIRWQGATYRRDHGEHVGAATPLICSDERHAAKVAALQADLDRYEEVVGELNETLVDRAKQAARAEAEVERLRTQLAESRSGEAILGRRVVGWADLAKGHQHWGQRRWNAWKSARARAQRQREQLAEVRALRDDLRGITGARYIADILDSILDPTEEPTDQTTPAATEATESPVPNTDLRPLKPYEKQQGGYWHYPPGCDVHGNGRVWITADQHNRLEAIRKLRDDMLGSPDTRWVADQLTGVLDDEPGPRLPDHTVNEEEAPDPAEDLGAALGRADADRAALIEVRMRERVRQAAIERVREALRTTFMAGPDAVSVVRADAIRRALDGAPATPAATQATEPHTGLVVEPYRNDRGEQAWVFRCWGTDSCDGWLSLDHYSQQSAVRARDRHVAEEHAEQPDPATCTDPEWLHRQYAAALHRYDYEHGLSSNDIPSQHHYGEAAAVLRVRDRHLQQLRQRLRLADELLATRDAELAAAKKTARGIGAWGVLQAIEQALPQGPTVAEAVADDARWWNGEKAGE